MLRMAARPGLGMLAPALLLGVWAAQPAVAAAAIAADGGASVRIELPRGKFATGDDPARSHTDFDDSGWRELSTLANYEKQGYDNYDGWSWYRIHVTIPASLRQTVHWQQRLHIYLSSVDDVDETFFNGTKIGQTGRLPDDPLGYATKWQALRNYYVDVASGLIRWDRDNVIAVRVYDGSGGGGFYRDMPYLNMAEIIDGLQLDASKASFRYARDTVVGDVRFVNSFPVDVAGTLEYDVYDAAAGRVLASHRAPLNLAANGTGQVDVTTPQRAGIEVRYRYTEHGSGKTMRATQVVPYLLTPPESLLPRLNGARVLGARPGMPVVFRLAATGEEPLTFSAARLPEGMTLDPASGVLHGAAPVAGDYPVQITVRNARGTATGPLLIRAGDTLALTPPMGWNSWNVFGLDVDDARVRAAADALVHSGLAGHGWSFVNIDDGWEAAARADDGKIHTNAKFPDMAALSGYLHARGLRFGIYSSPGPRTCGTFLGSREHERQDADSYAAWGVDYLKYDLCSYELLMSKQKTAAEYQLPYRLMGEALAAQRRDIVYNLCEYGEGDVWKWGTDVRGNSWRTTQDIEDTWASVSGIGFAQDPSAPYARPGGWNDPDMLVVGIVGWGGDLHPSRLTPDEQYSHVSLWSLLAAPLLLGNDLTRLDEFTRNLLANDEVIAVDQDPLGSAARRLVDIDGWQVWARKLADGHMAVGVFNLQDTYRRTHLPLRSAGLATGTQLRDLWRQVNLGPATEPFTVGVPAHGVMLFKTL